MFIYLEGKKRERFKNNINIPPPFNKDKDYIFFNEGGDSNNNSNSNKEEEAGNIVIKLENKLDNITSKSIGI